MNARDAEVKRYVEAYRNPNYCMGNRRRRDAERILAGIPSGSLLDVGAGRGEGIQIALKAGHRPVHGVEPVGYLADGVTIVQGVATDLPFATESFDTVMCLDVLEHLIAEDVEPALRELRRVAKQRVFLTAAENPHVVRGLGEMHISRRPFAEWQALLEQVFCFATISPLGKIGVSPGWLIEV